MKECPFCGAILSLDEINWGCASCGGKDDGTDSDEFDDDFDVDQAYAFMNE